MAANEIAKLGYQVDSNGLLVADRRLKKTMESSKKTESGIKELDRSFIGLGGAVGVAVTALVGFGAISTTTKLTRDFGKSLSSLSAITGAVGQDLEFYRRQAEEIGSTTTLSASQALEAFKLMASAKPELLASKEALAAVTREAVMLAEATGGELGLAAATKVLGGTLNQFQLEASKSSDVINILAASAQQGTASILNISESLVNSGAAANALGISLTETIAGLQALAKNNIIGSEAGTALNQVMLRLENTADEKLMPSVVGLNSAIQELSSRGMSNTEIMKMFGVEAFKAASALIGQRETLDQLSKSLDGTSTAYEQARVQVDNLDGDLLALNSVVESLSISLGRKLDPAMRSSVQAITSILSASEALEDSFNFLAVSGGAYAVFLGGKYVASSLAAVAADQKQIASNTILDASYKKSVAAKLAGDQAKIASEVRMLKAQQAALANQILITKSESSLASLRSVLSGVTGRLSVAESALAAATARTTAATVTATTASGLASKALTAQTGRAMATTAAMKALGAVSRFAFGPWGLLIGAIGAAATVFVTSKNQAEEMTRKINEQKTAIDTLVESYGKMTNAGRGRFWQDSTSALQSNLAAQTDINMKMAEARSRLLANPMNADNEVREIATLQQQLNELKKVYEQIHKERQALFTGPDESAWQNLEGDDGAGDSTTAEINKQIESLKQMQKEIGMTSDELFVFREVQKSIANKDLPETTAEIEQLARALVQAKNNISDAESAFSSAFTGTSDAMAEYDLWIDSVWQAANQAQILEQEMQRVKYAMEMGDLDESTARAYLKILEDQIEGLKEKSEDSNIFGGMAGDLREGILAFREFGEEGTKEYKRLTRAAQVFAAAQAFATGNILAGFAQVASVLGSLGGDDLKDISAEVQATQNLNVWGDKADSISRSMQITANATDKLVGINTNMLKALQIMQQGIAKASGLIVRDSVTPQVNTGALGIMANPLQENKYAKLAFGFADKLTFGIIGGLLGGKSKVVDEGIRIVGGTMSQLMEDVLVQGYQQVSYKKWRWGSTKNKTAFSNMDSSVGDQFSLVFGSIADSVYEGATMLGLSGSAVEEAINNFTIATKQVSLKGLSAEQQQKEIEAYFSQIFDGLALEVVEFLPEFQKVGEGYGETLTRIATQVAVLDEVSTRFGINFGDKMANPELYAKAADNIATLTGGLEEFINKTAGFTRFADEATQVEIAQNDLNRALAEVGLSLPSSTAGMWELMQSIDGSTEAGQKQIATLLNLQDSSYAYYQMLERQNEQYKNLSRNLRGIIESTYGLSSAAAQTSLDSAIAAAKMGDFGLALSGNFAAAMPKQSDFDSFADFAFEQAVTANKLEELAKLSDGQISVEERQLSQLEQINQALRESYTPTQQSPQEKENTENIKKMSRDIEQLTRNMQRAQTTTNEHLDRIANGQIAVRVE